MSRRLFLEPIPDAPDQPGQSNAPAGMLDFAPQCPGSTPYDPSLERGEDSLLCFALDAAALETVQTEFANSLTIFGN